KIDEITKKRKQILFILGSRRVGKTRIILQYIYKLIKLKVNPNKILFLSLDNTNLENLDWYEYIVESNFEYVFLDEVHYSPKWAQTLKSLYDLPDKKVKIICSGSSSKLIEDNKAFLTGRSVSLFITPLDFQEYKNFSNGDDLINEYLFYGGYPEFVLEREPNYLNELVKDIIEKDIIKVHKVKNNQYLFDVCQMLAKQIGFKGSSNKIANVLKLDNKTVENYIQYLKEVKLIDVIYQYSDSLNKKLYSPKKYYFNDLGIRNSFVGYSNIGSLVENAVFLHLVKRYGSKNIYYLSSSDSSEVDFVVRLSDDKVLFIESKYNNLKNAIENSLSGLFFKEIYGRKIIDRIVVTDGINSVLNRDNLEVKLVSLENFLTKNN
ncbi:MAG: ATP-binding protein, partial [Candidatus Woesebacteria bacterium]|nr:ATP-binding protein [Candidatus Woesebacteria bacterium]